MLKLLDIEDDLSLFGMLKENHNILAVTENGKRVKDGCFYNVQSFVSNDSSGSPMLSASFLSSFLYHNLAIGKTTAQSSTDRNPEGVNGEAIFAADGDNILRD